ncbi:MotA/TolQ/ExbB proton channel family protein [Pontiellaceae bacterium B12219]|nr:MotA/TolQ/ExbB proton channel family protein [Pontiellaceae bacterium B12219]
MMHELIHELHRLAIEGGIGFWALTLLAFGIAFSLLSISQALRLPCAPILSQRHWKYILTRRDIPPQLLHKLHNALTEKYPDDPFHQIDHLLFSNLDRRFSFTFVLIGAAPLMGLLGTVSGMLTTFSGIGSANAVAVDAVSQGVSEALITTQAGLVIGIASLLACSLMRYRFEQLRMGFLRVEASIKQLKD